MKIQDRLKWEQCAIRELNADYRHALWEHRIKDFRPALIEIVDSSTHWGRWIPETRTIQLARRLIWDHPWYQVVAILKHEMAHQLVDECAHLIPKFKPGGPHGEAFQWACTKLGVPDEFSGATADLQSQTLDWRTEKRDAVSEKMLERVRKLLALATSTNEHEALIAMNRVRELYARYNLEENSDVATGENKLPFVHIVISTGSKRMEAHERKVVGILTGHFFVEVILGQTFDITSGERHRSLTLLGKRENVLMAEYVYHFLLSQSRALAEQLLKQDSGASLRHSRIRRKSFRLGILQGFEDKLRAAEKPTGHDVNDTVAKALIKFNSDLALQGYIKKIYPRLQTSSVNSQRIDSSAYAAGKDEGRKITLSRPISHSSGNKGRLLGSH